MSVWKKRRGGRVANRNWVEREATSTEQAVRFRLGQMSKESKDADAFFGTGKFFVVLRVVLVILPRVGLSVELSPPTYSV